MMNRDFGQTKFITGIRAYAVLGVVLIHSGGSGLRQINDWGGQLTDFGKNGVYVFFVISGFIIADSYTKKPLYANYLIRRVLRIAPLYYFWIFIALIFGQTSKYWLNYFGVEKITTTNVILHLLFISFIDYSISNSILGVEWSLPIEMFYYFLLPLVTFPLLKSKIIYKIILLVLLSQLNLILLYLPKFSSLSIYSIIWNPIPYLICYVIGIFAWDIRKKIKLKPEISDIILSLNLVIITILILINNITLVSFHIIIVSFMTGSLLVFCNNKAWLTSILLLNPLIQKIGILSYGIYLSHFFVINMIVKFGYDGHLIFIISLFISVTISTFTYLIVEQPSRNLGKKLNRYLTTKN